MRTQRDHTRRNRALLLVTAMSTLAASQLTLAGCQVGGSSMDEAQLEDLGERYAAAWSSQDPARLAALYAGNGSLKVNDDEPAVGRDAITATADGFMTAFPDMVVRMDEIARDGDHVVFRWTWTGTNTGPGGTGRGVHISGYEEWRLDADGRIAESRGHFDDAEYQRQVGSQESANDGEE